MSIPPLVCSTPPPPEQCEDDKDQEDFDLNYHLSQEEDESNDYDYGNFSSFNHFKSTTTKTCPEFDMSQDDKKHTATKASTEIASIEADETNNRVTIEDDILEDLNLKIDVESTGSTQKNINEDIETNKSEKAIKPVLQDEIPADSSPPTFELKNDVVEVDNGDIAEESIPVHIDETQTLPEELVIEKGVDHSENQTCGINTVDEIENTNLQSNIIATIVNRQEESLEEIALDQNMKNSEFDEFDDFNDFQFTSSVKPTESVLDSSFENPWQNDASKNEEFGDFTANFGEDVNAAPILASDNLFQNQNEADDDFGDFDEFQCVNDMPVNKAPSETCDEVSVLNFQSSDSEYQIIERINKVIHTIFQEEIEGTGDMLESKLEVSLGETWSHLRETDIRQPYIVNWNNSLAQKTLLKALCIDSRNILFGPKWGTSMPKYAATLSAAPLQPQKQTGQSNIPQSETNNSEKATNKTWSDPFTADGQESCHTDRENTVVETGPTDLDVFEAAMPTKPEKIYSNTINIQPMRQINLPDTHIFTPTNSEIPRSKTIHYDNTPTPTVLLPQAVPENNTASQSIHSENDNDYWEFQDFRGIPDNKTPESTTNKQPKEQQNDTTNKANITLATQVLQPIKLEPIMPTLNWPDPGEVKETFDDFSDFMSNVPSIDQKQESMPQNVTCTDTPSYQNKNPVTANKLKSNTNDKLDDEFEMFQSALPTFKSKSDCHITKVESESKDTASTSQVISTNMTDFDIVFSKIEKVKSENISLSTIPIENVMRKVNNTPIINSHSVPSNIVPMANTSVLQPSLATPALTKQNHQKASQILEPLSLESYSQINWPNPGIDLQDLSRFNPVESLQSLKNDSNSQSKTASPVHSQKILTNNNLTSDDDIWGEFVSSKPKQQQALPKKQASLADDEEWTDFVSSPSVNPQNGLNTISLNVHTNSSIQKSSNPTKYQQNTNEISMDIPALNYITPKNNKSYNERHFQNL